MSVLSSPYLQFVETVLFAEITDRLITVLSHCPLFFCRVTSCQNLIKICSIEDILISFHCFGKYC